jgi:hypothetical protein
LANRVFLVTIWFDDNNSSHSGGSNDVITEPCHHPVN